MVNMTVTCYLLFRKPAVRPSRSGGGIPDTYLGNARANAGAGENQSINHVTCRFMSHSWLRSLSSRCQSLSTSSVGASPACAQVNTTKNDDKQ